MQPPFDQLDGVVSTEVGYAGGSMVNPTYQQVCAGQSGHVEAMRVCYDGDKISFADLLDIFWQNIDPTQLDGQFSDRGKHYQSVIFYNDEDERGVAETSKAALQNSGKFNYDIVTALRPLSSFYLAEDYHQKYYQKNHAHYAAYKEGSGRQRFIEQVWLKK
jgi:methionine-S-sulfoxide reductase